MIFLVLNLVISLYIYIFDDFLTEKDKEKCNQYWKSEKCNKSIYILKNSFKFKGNLHMLVTSSNKQDKINFGMP
jgi:protein tyrosine phosphatase